MQNSTTDVKVALKRVAVLLFSLLVVALVGIWIRPLSAGGGGGGGGTTFSDSGFTYQGYLEDNGTPVSDTCDFQFDLYDLPDGDRPPKGPTNVRTLVVDRGVFSTKIDFGSIFYLTRFWLSVMVRCPAGSGSYTTLNPRTEITNAPIALAMPQVEIIEVQGQNPEGGGEEVFPYVSYDFLSITADFFQSKILDVSEALGGTTIKILNSGAGYIETRGPNRERNFALSTSADSGADNGWLAIMDETGARQAGMYINAVGQGIVFGDSKSFRMANPADADTEIWYSSLEGPEAAAYVRGTAELVDGEANITLPDHFLSVASEEGMTVQVTPLSADSLGLAVVKKSLKGVEVRELQNGNGSYEFDFVVTAVRQGYEDYQVIRPATEGMEAGGAFAEPATPEEARVTSEQAALLGGR